MNRLFTLLLGIAVFSSVAGEPTESSFVVHFSTGPNWQADLSPAEQNSFKEHSANLRHLYEQGQIKYGGRYSEFGMVILTATDLEAAQALIADDPGIKAGIFKASIEPLSVFFPYKP